MFTWIIETLNMINNSISLKCKKALVNNRANHEENHSLRHNHEGIASKNGNYEVVDIGYPSDTYLVSPTRRGEEKGTATDHGQASTIITHVSKLNCKLASQSSINMQK